MIVYLGMPRCASSWIYEQLKGPVPKETHYLYSNPIDPVDYCKNRIFDFSTNNWSMDSAIVKSIDQYVSNYILTVRDPIDLAISYKTMVNADQSLDEFINTLIINKLLCYGDIIERWYNLVDPKKILIYDYNDLSDNNSKFIDSLFNDLNLPLINAVSTDKINSSLGKKHGFVSEKNLTILAYQCNKFEKITNLQFNFTINT